MARVSHVREERRSPRRRMPETRKRTRPGGVGRGVWALVVACAVLSVAAVVEQMSGAGDIRRGVHVGEVALGGKTPEEARAILGRSSFEGAGIRLTGAGGDATLPARSLGAELDVDSTVGRAYAVGRQGGIAGRVLDRARSPFGLEVPADVRYRSGAARAWVRGVAGRDEAAARDARVGISGTDVTVEPARMGYDLDVPATLGELDASLRGLRTEVSAVGEVREPVVTTAEAEDAAEEVRELAGAPIRLASGDRTWSVPEEGIASSLDVVRRDGGLEVSVDRDALRGQLANAYGDLVVEPVEAGYDIRGGVTVTPARDGRRVEEEKLLDAVEGGLFRGVREYEVPVVVDRPELTTAEAEQMKPTEVLGSYRTNYSIVPDDGTRVENLGISSGAVNGTLLAPGETFSMLDHVAGLDYNDSKVIVGGEEVNADGGGLCQVTSTLYNAANFAGLDVTERTPHSAQLPYIRPGMDATVWWGAPGPSDDLDMKFRNTTGGYLLLKEYVADDGHVYAEIWGRPDNTEVTMRSKPVYMDGNGSEWVTYQTVERDGEVVYDGELHRDSYEPLVDYKGNTIPPSDVPVAPVTP